MRFNLFTCILLAAMLVEASCSREFIRELAEIFVNQIDRIAHEVNTFLHGEEPQAPRSCIVPEPPTGASLTGYLCDGPCNYEPGNRVPADTGLAYSCNEGYFLIGSDVSVCRDGAWDTTVTCITN